MKNILKMTVIALITAVVVSVVVVALVGNQPEQSKDLGYTGTRFPNGLSADGFTQGGGVLTITATTTEASRTLTEAQLIASDIIDVAAVSGVAFTLTLPATSTMTTLLPKAGDMRDWVIDNQNLAATTTTIAAGTGIDLIAPSNADDIIDGQETSFITCYRKANTDVMCILSDENVKAD